MFNQEMEKNKNFARKTSVLFKVGRKSLGLNQEQLADKLDMSQGTLSKLERAQQIPSLITWLKFCDILNITPDVILSEVDFSQKVNTLINGLNTFRANDNSNILIA